MKKKTFVLIVLVVLLSAIPSLLVSAKTSVVRVRADVEWVESGIYVEAGLTYSIKTHGIAWTGSPSEWPDSKSGPGGQPGGGCSLNFPALPCNLNGAPYGALIGKVNDLGQAFLIGDAAQFTATESGMLYLGVNDDLNYHYDNLAGFTVQFK